MKQTRVKKSGVKSPSAEQVQTEPVSAGSSSSTAKTDDLLAEIDEILADVTANETAAQFVANYRQKGGQ